MHTIGNQITEAIAMMDQAQRIPRQRRHRELTERALEVLGREPTTALDVTLQAQALNLMLEMQRSMDMAVILVTHDLGVIAEVTERVVVMYLGRVVETAPVGALFARPEHPYARALIASIPRLTGPLGALAPIRGMVPSPYDIPPGCAFHTRCNEFVPGRRGRETPATVAIAADHEVECLQRDGRAG